MACKSYLRNIQRRTLELTRSTSSNLFVVLLVAAVLGVCFSCSKLAAVFCLFVCLFVAVVVVVVVVGCCFVVCWLLLFVASAVVVVGGGFAIGVDLVVVMLLVVMDLVALLLL